MVYSWFTAQQITDKQYSDWMQTYLQAKLAWAKTDASHGEKKNHTILPFCICQEQKVRREGPVIVIAKYSLTK